MKTSNRSLTIQNFENRSVKHFSLFFQINPNLGVIKIDPIIMGLVLVHVFCNWPQYQLIFRSIYIIDFILLKHVYMTITDTNPYFKHNKNHVLRN